MSFFHFNPHFLCITQKKQYKTKLVKRVYIPKGKGKVRPLGIPALEDKLVQSAAAKILRAIYESKFLNCSYAYRPGVGARDAAKDVRESLMTRPFTYVVDADIKGFFDNLCHDRLIELLERSINDKAFIGLIKKWLKAGILDNGEVFKPEKGTAQGGIISPILSNIYLHYVLDIWFDKIVKPRCDGQSVMFRYADDYWCAFQVKRDAERFYEVMEKRLNKFGLELSKEKTKLITFSRFKKHLKTSFTFLGFEYRWELSRLNKKDIIRMKTSRKKFRSALKDFTEWIKKSRNKRINKIFATLKRKLIGHYNYFGVVGNYDSVAEYYLNVMDLTFKWLNRRSQRRSFNYRGFWDLCKYFNVPKPRITETI